MDELSDNLSSVSSPTTGKSCRKTTGASPLSPQSSQHDSEPSDHQQEDTACVQGATCQPVDVAEQPRTSTQTRLLPFTTPQTPAATQMDSDDEMNSVVSSEFDGNGDPDSSVEGTSKH